MELKTLQKELQRLNELVGAWQQVDEITTIERELVLARLRDMYEAVRFGLEPSESVQAVAPVAVPTAEPIAAEEEQPFAEEEPLALEADDFFSLDAIVPFNDELTDELPAEPTVPEGEEVAPEVEEEIAPEIEEEVAPEVEEEEIAPEVEEEIALEAEEPAEESTEPTTEPVEEAAPEPVVDPEPAPVVEPAPEPVAETDPATEQNPFQTLFGAEPTVDHHRRKQRVIMSLYDVTEPEPVREPRPAEPAPVVEVRIEEPAEEEVVQLVPPTGTIVESDEESEVIEISGEELESIPEKPLKATPEKSHEPAPEEAAEAPEAEPSADEEALFTAPAAEENPAVLGEVIAPATTLADQLAARQTVNDLRPRVTDLRRAVGLNDKFLLIRDLFGGNGSLYEITIRKLNEFDNFDDCMIYIAEHFAWNPNSDGAKLMMDLLERKFEQ